MANLVSVPMANEPGALAKITTVLAEGGISIEGISLVPKGSMGEATFLVKDPDKATKVLQASGFPSKVLQAYMVTLSNQQGALADLCTRLTSAGINIEGLFGTTYGKAGIVALVTDDNAGAAKVLDQLSSD